MPVYDSVGVDSNESWSDISENVIFFVSLDDVPEHFLFGQNIHFAHIWIELIFRHFENVFDFASSLDFPFFGNCFILHLFSLGYFDLSFEKRDIQSLIFRGFNPLLLFIHKNYSSEVNKIEFIEIFLTSPHSYFSFLD